MPTYNLVQPHGFPIAVGRMRPQPNDPELHQHDTVELAIITQGAGRHETCDAAYPVSRGDVFVIPVGTRHGYARVQGLHLLNLGYDPGRLRLPLQRLRAMPGYRVLIDIEPRARRRVGFAGHLRLDDRELAWLLDAIAELEEELAQARTGWEESATATLVRILVRLARVYATQDDATARASLRLGTVLAYIDAHLERPLSLAQLCRVGRVSPRTLQRDFQALLGQSVASHVTARRLAVACEHLAAGTSVRESARAVGIHDPCYFARLFRRHLGCTARTYRLQRGSLHEASARPVA